MVAGIGVWGTRREPLIVFLITLISLMSEPGFGEYLIFV
jgi:hypothetical protein